MKRSVVFLSVAVLMLSACSQGGGSAQPTRAPILPTQSSGTVAAPTTSAQPTTSSGGAAALFQDDFSDPNSGWDSGSSLNGSTDYGSGDYVIRVETKQYSLWANPSRSFDGDVSVEVDAVPVTGPDANEMGVICRYQDVDNFMYASIGDDGYYAIYEIKDGQTTVLTGNGQLVTSDAIHQGQVSNHLKFVCKGSQYILSVNGLEVDTATDDSFNSGDVGLLAGAFDTGGVKIDFDNFLVTAP